jgi:putative SOS response-associated peptidase YedK
MCGRYAARRPPEEVADWFGASLPRDVVSDTGRDAGEPVTAAAGTGPSTALVPEEALLSPQAGIAPTDTVFVVVADEAGRRRLLPAQWGLVPSWAKDRSIASSTFNARIETAAEKPAFRGAMQRRRCLLPADAFYEWSGPKGARRPWLIRPSRRSSVPFLAFGGLFEHWRDPAGGILHSCTILTTPAAPDLEQLHDRAPLLIDRDEWDRWLDPAGGADTIMDLLHPTPAGSLELTPLGEPTARPQPIEQPALFPI